MTLRAYLRVFGDHWRLVLGIIFVSVGLAAAITAASPKVYTATAVVYVQARGYSDPTQQYQAGANVLAQVSTYATIVDTPPVLDNVRRDLNLPLSTPQLKSKVTATAATSQTLIDISATDPSPNTAEAIANSTARQLINLIESYNLDQSGKPTILLRLAAPATAPTSPTSPRPVVNILLGLLLGLLVAAATAVARDVLDTRIKDANRLATSAGVPLMGTIVEDPKASRHPIATRAGTRNARAENFRQLRANLQFANVDRHPRIIAITSSVPAEGKTMVAMNLASTLAEAGFSVCLVDADLRRPTIAETLGLAATVGLTNVLINQIGVLDALQSAGSNLSVLCSGPTPPNPSEVLASSYVREVIHSLLEHFDYIIIDAAPLLPVADGSEVAVLADGTLLVARHKMTTEPQIRRSVTSLARVDASLVGVVLNRIPNKRAAEYGYSYYRSEEPPHTPSRSELRSSSPSPRRRAKSEA